MCAPVGRMLTLERLGLGRLGFLGGDVAVLGHLADDPVAPDRRLACPAERMVVVGRLGQRGQVGGLLDRQILQLLVEIVQAAAATP